MSTRQNLALLTFGTALFASVATSRAQWTLYESADGAEVSLTPESPEASLQVDITARDIPAEAWGTASVTVEVLEAMAAEDTEADVAFSLDLVLVEETAEGDVEIEAVTGWSLGPATEENPVPELVTLTIQDLDRSGSYRVDATLDYGARATFDWRVEAEFVADGEAEVRGEPAIAITLDPAE